MPTHNFRLNVGPIDKQRLSRLNNHLKFMRDNHHYIKPNADYDIKEDEFGRIILYANHEMLECMVQELLFDPCPSEVKVEMRKQLRKNIQKQSDTPEMPEDFLKKL